MNIYVDGVLTPPADAGSLDGIPASFPHPPTAAEDGYVVTYVNANGDLELQPGGGGGMLNPMTAVGNLIVGGAVSGGIATPVPLAIGTGGYVLRSVAGNPAWREISAAGLLKDRAAAAAVREGQTYWATNAATGQQLSICLHKGGATYEWENLAYDLAPWTATPARASLAFPAPGSYTDTGWVGYPTGVGPNFGTGCSLVMLFWPAVLPASLKIVAARDSAMHLRIGDYGDRGQFGFYYPSIGTTSFPLDCTFTADNQPHVLAFSVTGGNVRSSFDGGVVQATACGAATAPTTENFSISCLANTVAYPCFELEQMEFRTYSTVLSDADLVAAGQSAVRTSGILPTLTGTLSFSLVATAQPQLVAEYEYGSLLMYGQGVKRRRTR